MLRYNYGITPEEYQALLEDQNERCAVCGALPFAVGDRPHAVDHDHETGEVRGLLCLRCNNGIGFFKNEPDRLRKAALYLESERPEVGKNENRLGKNDTHCTPPSILDAIVKALGPIGLDPCSNPNSIVPSVTAIMLPQYAPATARFAQRTFFGDGLKIVWRGHGLVFANPPYSAPGLQQFIAKAYTDSDSAVLLVPVRTGNVFWLEAAAKADVEVFLPRVTHIGAKTHSPFHQMLLFFGNEVEAALGLGVLGTVRVHPRHTKFAPVGDSWRRKT